MEEITGSTVCLINVSDRRTDLFSDWNEGLQESDYDSDDSSRGYCTSDSFNSSSSETDSDSESDHSLTDKNDLKEMSEESSTFQNTSSLCHSFEYILCLPEMCDVTFLVGRDKTPVYGLKSVIATRSSVLCNLILNHQRKFNTNKLTSSRSSKVLKFLRLERKKKSARTKIGGIKTTSKLQIPVSHFDKDVFRKLVYFLHVGHVTVTQDTLIGLLCAASEFKVIDLNRACWKFLDRSLSLGRLTEIIRSAEQYSEHPAYQSIADKVKSCQKSQMNL